MGNINRNEIVATIAAIEGSLARQGYGFEAGAGIAAANRIVSD
jgi:aspartate aminotransferase-like enzyme